MQDNTLNILSTSVTEFHNSNWGKDPENENAGYIEVKYHFKLTNEHNMFNSYLEGEPNPHYGFDTPQELYDFYHSNSLISSEYSKIYTENVYLTLTKDEQTGAFIYHSYVVLSPSVKAILAEIEELGKGVNYSRTTAEFRMIDLLISLESQRD